MRIDQLQDYLEADLAWRKAEISQLFRILNDVEAKDVVLKSIILLLYAHWEGYIKKSSKHYLKYVSEQKVKIKDLTLNFKAIVLKESAQKCFEQNSLTLANEIRFINKQKKMDDHAFKINVNVDDEEDKSIINTKDNLSSKVLNNIIDIIGMKYNDAMKKRSNYIDFDLVRRRNSIGHGNKLIRGQVEEEQDLSFEDAVKLKDFIMLMLDYFFEVVINYADNEYYLAANNEKRNEYEEKMEEHLSKYLAQMEEKDYSQYKEAL